MFRLVPSALTDASTPASPTSVAIPVSPEPLPENDVAVRVPFTSTPVDLVRVSDYRSQIIGRPPLLP